MQAWTGKKFNQTHRPSPPPDLPQFVMSLLLYFAVLIEQCTENYLYRTIYKSNIMRKKTNKLNTVTHLHWLTSTREPILDVVKEICWSPMTISSSCRATRTQSRVWHQCLQYIQVVSLLHNAAKCNVKNNLWCILPFCHSHEKWKNQ